jgi:hypothetical protein
MGQRCQAFDAFVAEIDFTAGERELDAREQVVKIKA